MAQCSLIYLKLCISFSAQNFGLNIALERETVRMVIETEIWTETERGGASETEEEVCFPPLQVKFAYNIHREDLRSLRILCSRGGEGCVVTLEGRVKG